MLIDAMTTQKYAAAVAAVAFMLCTILLIGFRRGRLRGYNIVVVFVMAVVAARTYAQIQTGDFGGWWGAVPWLALAVCGVWGVIGMMGIVGTDDSVYARPRSDVDDRTDRQGPVPSSAAVEQEEP